MGTDSRAKRVLLVALLFFVFAVALQINGSSIGVWKDILRDNYSPARVIFSTPKSVRSDEWMGWTPSTLSQALHQPSFPLENANLGAGKSPLLMSVPVRHPVMFLRPQLYGFFLFDLETAFAFYWNFKIVALFVSFFFLLRLLTRGNFWISLFGAGWVLFSAYTQWWFSCPPMLPEMLGSWATGLICIFCLFHPVRLIVRTCAILALLIAAVNFTLCFYPPFQIPLVYLGAAVVIGWWWQNRRASLSWRAGGISLSIATLAMVAVLLPYLVECRPTLEILASTKYPGSRRTHGGEMAVRDTFSGALGFFNSAERDYLTSRGNACEASNFYPLWILVLAGSGTGLWLDRRNRRIEMMLLAGLGLFLLYSLCPLPSWLCQWTFLDYVTGTRMLLPIGIAGILFASMVLAGPTRSLPTSSRLMAAIAVFVGVTLLFMVSYPGNEKFLTPGRSVLLIVLNVLFIALYFLAPLRVFCGFFLLCLILNNAGVNPVAIGLGALLDASPAPLVQYIRTRDPEGKWISYSNTWLPQFLKAQGVNVVNGLNIVPDPNLCREMDPNGNYESIWNRYGYAIFRQAGEDEKRRFESGGVSAYTLKISPVDPVLLARGVRYAVFPESLGTPNEYGMRLLASIPESHFWIYQLPHASLPDISTLD